MPAHRATRRSVRPARRRVIWAEFDAIMTFTANSQWFNLDLLQTFKAATGSTVAKSTIMRTHAYLAHTGGASTSGDRIWTGFRVSDLDDTSGVVTVATTVANPRDNPYVDWAFMSRHSTDGASYLTPGAVGAGMANSQASVVYDLHSRRKLENVQDTWSFTLLQDNVTTVASTYHFFARTLIALP